MPSALRVTSSAAAVELGQDAWSAARSTSNGTTPCAAASSSCRFGVITVAPRYAREAALLGIDDDRDPGGARGVDRVARDLAGHHALGVVRQHAGLGAGASRRSIARRTPSAIAPVIGSRFS